MDWDLVPNEIFRNRPAGLYLTSWNNRLWEIKMFLKATSTGSMLLNEPELKFTPFAVGIYLMPRFQS